MATSGSTDFLRKNQQHIQQLMMQRQHEISTAQAAVIAEERQRLKLRQKVLSMRENRPSNPDSPDSAADDANGRTLVHSDTMPGQSPSQEKAASPARRCISAVDRPRQQVMHGIKNLK